jgi:hypothetical protein
MTKQQTIDTLKSQLPGFYSAEQVIALIDGIEVEAKQTTLSELGSDKVSSLVRDMVEEICDQADSLIDDYELEMNGREVEMTSITLNEYSLRTMVEEYLKDNNIMLIEKEESDED